MADQPGDHPSSAPHSPAGQPARIDSLVEHLAGNDGGPSISDLQDAPDASYVVIAGIDLASIAPLPNILGETDQRVLAG